MDQKIRARFETLPEDVQQAILRLREQPDPREDPKEVLELRLFEMRDRVSRNARNSRRPRRSVQARTGYDKAA